MDKISNLGRLYNVDKDLAENGVWIDLGEGVKIQIVRIKSQRARKCLTRLNLPHNHLLRQNRALPADTQDRINERFVAEGLLLDWSGIQGEDGEELEFSPETALEVLRKYPDFLDDVCFFAMEAESFRAEEELEAEGNSSGGSSGSSTAKSTTDKLMPVDALESL